MARLATYYYMLFKDELFVGKHVIILFFSILLLTYCFVTGVSVSNLNTLNTLLSGDFLVLSLTEKGNFFLGNESFLNPKIRRKDAKFIWNYLNFEFAKIVVDFYFGKFTLINIYCFYLESPWLSTSNKFSHIFPKDGHFQRYPPLKIYINFHVNHFKICLKYDKTHKFCLKRKLI